MDRKYKKLYLWEFILLKVLKKTFNLSAKNLKHFRSKH